MPDSTTQAQQPSSQVPPALRPNAPLMPLQQQNTPHAGMPIVGTPQAGTPQGRMSPLDQKKAELLSQLNDIQTPDQVGWWPPAIGWWVIVLLLGSAVYYSISTLVHKYKNNRYRKTALRVLSDIEKSTDERNSCETSHATIKLLKQTFFTAYPSSRQYVAGLYGIKFLQLLDATLAKNNAFEKLHHYLESSLYGKKIEKDVQQQSQLIIAARVWIKHHPRLNNAALKALLENDVDAQENSSISNRLEGGYAPV